MNTEHFKVRDKRNEVRVNERRKAGSETWRHFRNTAAHEVSAKGFSSRKEGLNSKAGSGGRRPRIQGWRNTAKGGCGGRDKKSNNTQTREVNFHCIDKGSLA